MGQTSSKKSQLVKSHNDSGSTTTTNTNSDANVIPHWINKKQFLEILTANVPHFSRIRHFSVRPVSKAGESYSSLILRIRINVKLIDKTVKPMSFILKVPHESARMQQMLKTVNFFNVENATYTELITKFEDLYKSVGMSVRFAPRHYKFTESLKKEPKLANTVLMEDLDEAGYHNINRLECLSMEQTKLVLRKLAQYHAASAQFRAINGPYPELFTQAMFGSNKKRALSILEGIMGPFKKMFLENISYYKNGDRYYEKFALLFAKMSSKFLSLSVFDPKEFNVINHGDCCINNLLFKRGKLGELQDMTFVDFQLPKYGHPSIDLLNLIISSVHIDHKLKNFDYFIKYYHDQLVKHLKLLKYTEPAPRLAELHMQLYKYGIWAITASVMVLPIVLLDHTEKTAEYQCQLYLNARYKANIEQIIPWLDNRGLLDL